MKLYISSTISKNQFFKWFGYNYKIILDLTEKFNIILSMTNTEISKINQWKEWNRQGFIPGPDETESEYNDRISFCQNIEQRLKETEDSQLPFEINDAKSKDILEEAFPLTEKFYGIEAKWIPVFFSNHQLAPWHGGCAWIFQLNEQSPTSAFLQLRARFRDSPTFLGIYNRQELIAHETSHVGRMLYQEPQFEEFFAYQSSSSPFRRWVGPIIQSSKESFFILILLGFVVLSDLALLSLGPQMFWISLGLKLLPLFVILYGIIRLFIRHRALHQCLKNLKKIYPPLQAQHLCYRLRDAEIKEFSKLTPQEIQLFISRKAQNSFRWNVLQNIYSFKL